MDSLEAGFKKAHAALVRRGWLPVKSPRKLGIQRPAQSLGLYRGPHGRHAWMVYTDSWDEVAEVRFRLIPLLERISEVGR